MLLHVSYANRMQKKHLAPTAGKPNEAVCRSLRVRTNINDWQSANKQKYGSHIHVFCKKRKNRPLDFFTPCGRK